MKTIDLSEKKLSLTNDGALELFFIGAGSAFTKRQYQTNLLIVKGEDHLLVDCGTKCNQALFELGVPISSIRNFLITHSHADHIGGLEEVSLIGRYVSKKKPVMIINETYQYILWDMSLRGGCAYNEEEARDMLGFSDFWDVVRPQWMPDYTRETFSATIGAIDIKMMRTKHIPDSSSDWQSSFWSCGVIIDDRVMFTSDTRYDEDLVLSYDKRFNFEAIFHDCQFYTGGVHASLEELKNLPADVKKKMYLSHYNDNWEEFEGTVREYGFADLAKQHVYYAFP
ncbi:MAG TPA: MBL fold metallo-hydrolase [Spirochaetota bacterium]|nr:MBL fold metallo-hydrolase [Spirochaetota bacterium]